MEQKNNSVLRTLLKSRELSLVIVLTLFILIIQLRNPVFLSGGNINDLLRNYSVTMIVALGMMGVLIVGGIDISVGSTLAMSGMTMALLMRDNPGISTPLAFLISTAVGLLGGLFNGLVTVKGKVPPIITTMGTMNIFRGITYLIAQNQWVAAIQLPDNFKSFANSKYLSFGLVNNMIMIMLVAFVIFYFFMRYSRIGRRIYATGSNEYAAKMSGINTDRIKILTYAILGTLCGLGGAMWVSVYASAQGNMAIGLEMDAIAACVIGGVSLSGGRGSVVGVFLGALIMAIIGNALPLIGVSQFYQTALKGLIILVTVILNVLGQRQMTKRNLGKRDLI